MFVVKVVKVLHQIRTFVNVPEPFVRSKAPEFHCEVCKSIFSSNLSLEQHISRSHEKQSCNVCNTVLANEKCLLQHMQAHKEVLKCINHINSYNLD